MNGNGSKRFFPQCNEWRCFEIRKVHVSGTSFFLSSQYTPRNVYESIMSVHTLTLFTYNTSQNILMRLVQSSAHVPHIPLPSFPFHMSTCTKVKMACNMDTIISEQGLYCKIRAKLGWPSLDIKADLQIYGNNDIKCSAVCKQVAHFKEAWESTASHRLRFVIILTKKNIQILKSLIKLCNILSKRKLKPMVFIHGLLNPQHTSKGPVVTMWLLAVSKAWGDAVPIKV